ncbi:hypothetical protein [Burkholderia multivorans]|nr:hypothetical protein [Burkholderia multivorans]
MSRHFLRCNVKAHWTHKGRDYCDMHKPAEMAAQHAREVRA